MRSVARADSFHLIASDPELDLGKFVQPVLGTTMVDGVLLGIPQHPIW